MKPTQYLLSHWRGAQPLWQTVWINLFAGLCLVHLGIDQLVPSAEKLTTPLPAVPVFAGILLYLVLVTWQVTGTVRAMEQHIKDGGGMSSAWGIQAGLLAAFFIVIANIWGLWLTTQVVPETENFEERMEREHASKYNLSVSNDGFSINLSGEITLGVNRKFERLLADYPNLKTMILTSEGGNIYEGRGLAKKIREAGMNTHVESECSSACTLVFIGGVERTISPDAKLGFHQYRVDADYVVAFADPEAEQSRDQSLFAEAGVSADFLDNMYEKTAGEMWFPPAQELFDAGVITSQVR